MTDRADPPEHPLPGLRDHLGWIRWWMVAIVAGVAAVGVFTLGVRTDDPDTQEFAARFTAIAAIDLVLALMYPAIRARLKRARRRRGAPEVDDGGHADLTFMLRARSANLILPGSGLVIAGAGRQAMPYLWCSAGLLVVACVETFAGGPAAPLLVLYGLLIYASAKATIKDYFGRFGPAVYLAGEARDAELGTDCPRCGARQRTPSGWCGPCEDLLEPASPALIELSRRYVDAVNARDHRAALKCFSYPCATHHANGQDVVLTPRRHVAALRILTMMFPDATAGVEALYSDPDDPSTVWSRESYSGTSVDGLTRILARRVTRARIVDGRVAEVWQYPALGDVLVAT